LDKDGASLFAEFAVGTRVADAEGFDEGSTVVGYDEGLLLIGDAVVGEVVVGDVVVGVMLGDKFGVVLGDDVGSGLGSVVGVVLGIAVLGSILGNILGSDENIVVPEAFGENNILGSFDCDGLIKGDDCNISVIEGKFDGLKDGVSVFGNIIGASVGCSTVGCIVVGFGDGGSTPRDPPSSSSPPPIKTIIRIITRKTATTIRP